MIRAEGLTRSAGGRPLLEGVDLEIGKGEIYTVIGPSGSGKSTLLRLLDLLDAPTSGTITIDGERTDGSRDDRLRIRRRMAMVFQKPSVLNTTIEENVAAGLKFRKTPRGQIESEVRSVLDLVGLSHLTGRRAVSLSGGEMQRLAVARAIVTKPDILFLDEPTANLDPANAEMIEDLILHINKTFKTTMVLSTHDMIQGQRLAHRIGVIMGGRLVQTGDLNAIFYHPVNGAVASFVGITPIRGGIIESGDDDLVTIAVGPVKFQAISNKPPKSKVCLCIRPEDITLNLCGTGAQQSSARNCLPGTVSRMTPHGPFTRVMVDCSGVFLNALLTRKSCEEMKLENGTKIVACIKATSVHVIPDV